MAEVEIRVIIFKNGKKVILNHIMCTEWRGLSICVLVTTITLQKRIR